MFNKLINTFWSTFSQLYYFNHKENVLIRVPLTFWAHMIRELNRLCSRIAFIRSKRSCEYCQYFPSRSRFYLCICVCVCIIGRGLPFVHLWVTVMAQCAAQWKQLPGVPLKTSSEAAVYTCFQLANVNSSTWHYTNIVPTPARTHRKSSKASITTACTHTLIHMLWCMWYTHAHRNTHIQAFPR